MNSTFLFAASLGDWTDDKEGGFDLWWSVTSSYVVNGKCSGTTGAKKRAADVWLRPDDGTGEPTWSWVAYHPLSGETVAAGHRLATADEAKVRCTEVIHVHFYHKAARG